MHKTTRVTFRDTATVLEGRAVLPRLLFILLGIVVFREVEALDAAAPEIPRARIHARWLIVPRSGVETLSMLEEDTDGDS